MPVNRANRANVRRWAPMDSTPHSRGTGFTRTSHINLMRELHAGDLNAEDLGVSLHIHEPVAAHVEGDDFLLAVFFRFQSLIDRTLDPVGALRGGDEPLRFD